MSAKQTTYLGLITSILTCVTLAPLLMQGIGGVISRQAPAVSVTLAPNNAKAIVRIAIQRKPADQVPANAEKPDNRNLKSEGTRSSSDIPKEPLFVHDRKLMADLSLRVLQSEPLNLDAVRALGYVEDLSGRKDAARKLMQIVVKRSAHSLQARSWILKDAAYRLDFDTAIKHLDLFYRAHQNIRVNILSSFVFLADDPVGLTKIIEALKSNPPWRQSFLVAYSSKVKNLDNPMKIFMALQASNKKIDDKIVNTFANNLVKHGLIEEAYYIWLQTLTPEELTKIPLLNNGGFEQKISEAPFSWKLNTIRGSQSKVIKYGERTKRGNALQITFFGERFRGASVSQITMLTPGKYKVSGAYRMYGIDSSRGLVWRVACLAKNGRVIGAGPRLRGDSKAWEVVQFEFEVPEQECKAQRLSLDSAARNGPESIISGRILIDNITIGKI